MYERRVGTPAQVYNGTAHHTVGGVTRNGLVKDRKTGEIKSIRKVYQGSKNPWSMAVKRAREELGITGFQLIQKGTPLYRRAVEIYRNM